jgi:hypothetical protein
MYNKSKEKIAKPILSQKTSSNIPRPPSKQTTNVLPSIKNMTKPVQVIPKRLTSAEMGNKTEKSKEKVGSNYLKKQEGLKRVTGYSGLSSQKSK